MNSPQPIPITHYVPIPVTSRPPQREPSRPRRRIIDLVTLAESAGKPEHRYALWDEPGRWERIAASCAETWRWGQESGVPIEFLLHRPFGDSPDAQMELDQYCRAREMGLDYLCDGFVEAMAWLKHNCPGVRVTAYLGKYAKDRTFDRIWASLAPVAEAMIDLALDGSSDLPADDALVTVASRVRSMGLSVYWEGLPGAHRPHLSFGGAIQEVQWWDATYPNALHSIAGDVLLLMDTPAPHKDTSEWSWLAPYLKSLVNSPLPINGVIGWFGALKKNLGLPLSAVL